MKTAAVLPALASLLSIVQALPSTAPEWEPNWEPYTTKNGYESVRVKPGMGPGSQDYERRFGAGASNLTANPLLKRQNGRYTVPRVGATSIPFGCDTNIQFDVLGKLWDLCSDVGCDHGRTVTYDTTYPEDGREVSGRVTLQVSASTWPFGMQEAVINAVQAEAIPEAVDNIEITSQGGGNSPFNPGRAYRCNVAHSSNFFSVVMRNEGFGESIVAQLDVDATFSTSRTSGICGKIGDAGEIIVGTINGLAGGFFGFVRAMVCN